MSKKASSDHTDLPVSPKDYLQRNVASTLDNYEQERIAAVSSRQQGSQSDAVRRHFSRMYHPRQLQEVNDALEMSWTCSIWYVNVIWF